MKDQKLRSVFEEAQIFVKVANELKEEHSKEGKEMDWDKDTEKHLEFVVSASNLRSHIYNIERKSKFDVKSMAGNKKKILFVFFFFFLIFNLFYFFIFF